jgi:DNA-binding NtrC family response regulator
VHLAELDDFLLLKRIQALEAFVPLVITATTGDKASARRLLEQGAFDLITTPVEHE